MPVSITRILSTSLAAALVCALAGAAPSAAQEPLLTPERRAA